MTAQQSLASERCTSQPLTFQLLASHRFVTQRFTTQLFGRSFATGRATSFAIGGLVLVLINSGMLDRAAEQLGYRQSAHSIMAQAPEQKGLPFLDEATDKQLSAESIGDMEKVVGLCEKALREGLDDENKKFARQLAASTLVKIAEQRASKIAEQQRDKRWQGIRDLAIKDLEKARSFDDNNANVHMMRARLLALPGGNRNEALASADRAIKLLADDKRELVRALLLRSGLRMDPQEQIADLNAAVDLEQEGNTAREARALVYLSRGEGEKAAKDFAELAERDPNNPQTRFAYAMALISINKLPEALEQATKIIEANPKLAGPYKLRAQVKRAMNQPKEAATDLDSAVQLEPQDLEALLLRADVYEDLKDYDRARADVEQVLQIRPGLPAAILQRAQLYSLQKRYDLAIVDLGQLLQQDPKNVQLRVQIAQLYLAGGWPRKAIEYTSQILQDVPDNWIAHRGRGDAYLAIGKHEEAIADFEVALKLAPEHSGILNNFAWVLATTPEDKLRNAERSIELATKACEITKYEESHILSTLAAGYAEKGDFETAIKWSTKAVEAGTGEQKEQLSKELESYQQKKAWRESQSTEEKPNPPELPAAPKS